MVIRFHNLLSILILATLAAPAPANTTPGPLVIIGGALASDNEAIYQAILDRRLPDKPICVLPTASGQPRRSMKSYVKDFRRYGGSTAAQGIAITISKPEQAAEPETVQALRSCGGFFFTGGDQSRIVEVFRPGGEPSPADTAIREVRARGGVVAGTSAGAAIMSDPMIGGGSSSEAFLHGATPNEDSLGVWVRDGMGFLPPALVDQHCLARGRLGRLLVAMAENNMRRFGFCIDEDTALVVDGSEARVVGTSGVVVLDLDGPTRTAGRGIREGRLWLLGHGDRLELESGRVTPDDGKSPWVPARLDATVPPSDPWVGNALHRYLTSFAGSILETAILGDPPAALTLRKGDGFHTLTLEGKEPYQFQDRIFAGPFEVDWLPDVETENDLVRCQLIQDSRRQLMNADDYTPLAPGRDAWLIQSFNGANYNRLLGVRVEEVRNDYARLKMPFKPDLLHPGGVVHGGSIASLLDSAAALAIFSRFTEPPRSIGTVDLHVHYLEAVVDEDLIAHAAIRRRGRSIVFVTVEVTTASGKPVAHGELSFRVVLA